MDRLVALPFAALRSRLYVETYSPIYICACAAPGDTPSQKQKNTAKLLRGRSWRRPTRQWLFSQTVSLLILSPSVLSSLLGSSRNETLPVCSSGPERSVHKIELVVRGGNWVYCKKMGMGRAPCGKGHKRETKQNVQY